MKFSFGEFIAVMTLSMITFIVSSRSFDSHAILT